MKLATPVKQQTQPTPFSCTATCVAMAVGLPVESMGVVLDNCLDTGDFGVWLAERGIWMRRGIFIDGHGEQFKAGALYMIGVPSLNLTGSTHCVLMDTRVPTGEKALIFDPNFGRDGLRVYSKNIAVLDFVELIDRSSPYVCVGQPPESDIDERVRT